MLPMASCLNSPIKSKTYTKRYTKQICSQQFGFVLFSNTFIIGFSLDELNAANISFYEINIF